MIRKLLIIVLLLAMAWVGFGWWTLYRQRYGVHDIYYLVVPIPSPISALTIYLAQAKFSFFRTPSGVTVTVPFWLACLVLGAYPSFAFCVGPFRRFLRGRRGQCLRCGYNLFGNVTGACPECGMATAAQSKKKSNT